MPREFKATDLLGIMACLFILLAAAAIPALGRARHKAAKISCVSNLKGVGISFRIWANDSEGLYPPNHGFKDSTLRTDALEGRMFRVFQVMSNELSSTETLFCPADDREAQPKWSLLTNTSVSYFVGLDATDTKPNMLLAGDRNLTIDGKLLSGIISLGTNLPAIWTEDMHRNNGNIGLADGSVKQLTTELLRQQLKHSGDATNLLVFP